MALSCDGMRVMRLSGLCVVGQEVVLSVQEMLNVWL